MKIVLDIETLQASKEDWAELRGVELAAKSEGRLFVDQEEAEQEKEFHKSTFDGTYSRICCIGIIILNDDLSPVEAVAWYGSNEAEILRQFWDRMGRDRPKLIITYNGLGFDLPFIKKRSVIHQVKPTMEINLAKFRTEPVYDVMAVWGSWDFRAFTKLDVLARALGVETKSGSGSQVAEMWAEDKKKAVAEYCLQDVYVTYACYCKMIFKDPLTSAKLLAKQDLILLD